MEDLQGMLCQVLQLLSGEGVNQGLHNPAAIMEWDSPITQLVCKTGGNFLLLDWLLSALGGAPIHGAAADWWMDWGPGRLPKKGLHILMHISGPGLALEVQCALD